MTRTDTASRTVTAPPDRVYRALVDPEAMLQWLPPPGMTARFERFRAHAGGGYRMVLTYADAAGAPGKATADSDAVDVRFIELVPGVRVVQAVDFVSDDPAFAGTMTEPVSRSAPMMCPTASRRQTMPPRSPVHWPTLPPTWTGRLSCPSEGHVEPNRFATGHEGNRVGPTRRGPQSVYVQ